MVVAIPLAPSSFCPTGSRGEPVSGVEAFATLSVGYIPEREDVEQRPDPVVKLDGDPNGSRLLEVCPDALTAGLESWGCSVLSDTTPPKRSRAISFFICSTCCTFKLAAWFEQLHAMPLSA